MNDEDPNRWFVPNNVLVGSTDTATGPAPPSVAWPSEQKLLPRDDFHIPSPPDSPRLTRYYFVPNDEATDELRSCPHLRSEGIDGKPGLLFEVQHFPQLKSCPIVTIPRPNDAEPLRIMEKLKDEASQGEIRSNFYKCQKEIDKVQKSFQKHSESALWTLWFSHSRLELSLKTQRIMSRLAKLKHEIETTLSAFSADPDVQEMMSLKRGH